ncbi:MAG: S1C family serine protease, partial [Microbacterium gubbeenense]
MSNDIGSPIPPLPERSAQDAAAEGAYPPPTATYQSPNPGPTSQPSYKWAPQPQNEPKKKERSTGGAKLAGLVVVAALIGGGVGFGGAWLGLAAFDGSDEPAAVASNTGQGITINNPDDVNETAAVAASALPSVVTIEAQSSSAGGSGSGVVLSEDGYVLTNTHVVTLGGATSDAQIRVTGSDGTLYDATIVGTDPIYDLAVIKLEGASGMTPMDFADSSKVNIGDNSVAIGAPMGLPNTVTTGVISNTNRSIEIQSSAAPEGDDTGGGQGGEGEDDNS